MTLPEAEALADEILAAISPYCIEARVAGSVRRKKPADIKDVEIVAIPITNDWQAMQKLRDIVNQRWGAPRIGAFPSRYTQVRGRANIDLFWQTRATFGLNMFIRTGSAAWVQRALAYWKKITNGGYSEGALLHLADGTIVPTLTEEAVFEALKCKFVPPERRA